MEKTVFIVLEKSDHNYQIEASHMQWKDGAVLFFAEAGAEHPSAIVNLDGIYGVVTRVLAEKIYKH